MVIRHLATSWSGSVIAAGEFEHIVHVWDLQAERHLATFPTILDFGGRRLAITADGKNCFAAAYQNEGIAAYATADGSEIWHRKNLKNIQTLRISEDDRCVYACFDDRSCHVLCRETGETIKSWAGVRNVWESPYQPVLLLEMQTLVLQSLQEQRITSFGKETFAVLCVAFAPGLVCVSESTGPLRCLDTLTGEERWRFVEKGHHFLEVAFSESTAAFVGVCWHYERGGSFRLLRFQPQSGEVSVVADLGTTERFKFCVRGTRLVSWGGTVMDTETGYRQGVLGFPRA
jgi:outer membrane protein assembly factor BamB